jgi:uncharacterized protein (DUF2461 family)
MTGFEGFTDDALEFYDRLIADNSKTYWTAHKAVYDHAIAAPMQALVDALAPEFGSGRLFRPYRDVRFSKDKTPYKTGQANTPDLLSRPGPRNLSDHGRSEQPLALNIGPTRPTPPRDQAISGVSARSAFV